MFGSGAIDRSSLPIRAPAEAYISPKYFQREIEEIFRKCWLLVGRNMELARPGDFITRDFPFLQAALLITRDSKGKLRAFHNVCSHRLARLTTQASGNTRRFTCPYHGWSYDIAGRLLAIPDRECFGQLDKRACSLSPVAVESSNGLIFINLEDLPSQTLRNIWRE